MKTKTSLLGLVGLAIASVMACSDTESKGGAEDVVPLSDAAVATPGAVEAPVAVDDVPDASLQPDVVIVLENSLRADAEDRPFGEYAFVKGLGVMPSIDYQWTYVQTVHSFVSLGSMLTGRYPSAIPLCSHPMGVAPQNAPWCAQIPDTMPTIPEVLALYGYDTVYATTQRRMTEHNQVAAQFQETLTVEMSGDQGLSSVVDSAIQWWGEHQDKPRFMVVHDSLEGALRSAAPPVHNQDIPTSVVGRILTVYHQVANRRGELLGRLLQHLKDNETQRPLWVIVTSGHGTNLGETSGTPSLPLQLTHHDILLERTLHVPLVVFGPKSGHPKLQPSADTLVEPTIVELVDLMPTVTTLAQAATPANLPGKDLLAQLDGNANDGDSYAEFGDMLSLRSGQHLMMARLWMHGGTSMDPEITRRLKAAPNPGSTFLLHEVVGDPMQVSELVEQEPDVARQMYERMIEVRVGPGAPPGGGLSNEQVQALRNSGALNYW